jgi:phosphate transport system permease protein
MNGKMKQLSAKRLAKRYAAEKRFRWYGIAAITGAMAVLVLLVGSIAHQGYSGFFQTYLELSIEFSGEMIDPDGDGSQASLKNGDYAALIKASLRARFPEATSREQKSRLYKLVSSAADLELRDMVLANPALVGNQRNLCIVSSDDVDMFEKGYISREDAESDRRVSNDQIVWLDALRRDGAIQRRFSRTLFTSGDSREPELAGIRGAIVGSFWTLMVTLLLSFPVGVLAATYLEEFAPENRWTDLIEVNINNLAAVPSILFGLLGLAVFLNWFGMPRSAPLVGGIVLALMTLPTIIIASRSALKAVPPSIREAALAVGASPLQVVTDHVWPLAMPGILTGTIIGMSRALGETAPLLMIGMVAFVVDVPGGITDPATVLPVQVFIWSDSPERAFVAKTAAASMVLLAFLIGMNGFAVVLRRRFERRW